MCVCATLLHTVARLKWCVNARLHLPSIATITLYWNWDRQNEQKINTNQTNKRSNKRNKNQTQCEEHLIYLRFFERYSLVQLLSFVECFQHFICNYSVHFQLNWISKKCIRNLPEFYPNFSLLNRVIQYLSSISKAALKSDEFCMTKNKKKW